MWWAIALWLTFFQTEQSQIHRVLLKIGGLCIRTHKSHIVNNNNALYHRCNYLSKDYASAGATILAEIQLFTLRKIGEWQSQITIIVVNVPEQAKNIVCNLFLLINEFRKFKCRIFYGFNPSYSTSSLYYSKNNVRWYKHICSSDMTERKISELYESINKKLRIFFNLELNSEQWFWWQCVQVLLYLLQ